MLRLLANENVPNDLMEALRTDGCDVAWMRSDAPGSPDHVGLACAVADRGLLPTFDKDFGDVALHYGPSATCGIVLLRLRSTSSAALAAEVVAVLASCTRLGG